MLGTNRQFATLLEQVEFQIGAMERSVAHGAAQGRVASALDELWARRRALKLLLLNRQVESTNKVVDFQRWRDGNGALYLCIPPAKPQKRARA